MIADSNTSRYLPPTPRLAAVPGRFEPAGDGSGSDPCSPTALAAELRDCAADLDVGRYTGMMLVRAAGLMREAAGVIEGLGGMTR